MPDQGGDDGGQVVDAHQHHQGATQPGQRAPVDQAVRVVRWDVAGDDHGLVGHSAVGQRDPGQRRHRERAGHPGHHGHRDTGLDTGLDLLPAAAEDERVATLEPDHEPPGPGMLDQSLVDRLLSHRPTPGQLRGIDHLDVTGQFVQQGSRSEPIGHHHVGVGQQPPAAHGDQIGVTGPTSDDRHRARSGLPGRHRTEPPFAQRLDDPVPDRRQPPRVVARPRRTGTTVTGVWVGVSHADHTDPQATLLAGGRRHGSSTGCPVGPHAEHPDRLRLGRDRLVHRGPISGGQHVPGAGNVPGGEVPPFPAQLARTGHRLDRRGGLGRHQHHLGAGLEHGRQPALGHRPGTDHQHPSAGEPEPGEVGDAHRDRTLLHLRTAECGVRATPRPAPLCAPQRDRSRGSAGNTRSCRISQPPATTGVSSPTGSSTRSPTDNS